LPLGAAVLRLDSVCEVATAEARMGRTREIESGQYYAGLGVAVGAGVGVTVGVLVGGWAIALGICLGAGVGVVVGAALDARRTHGS